MSQIYFLVILIFLDMIKPLSKSIAAMILLSTFTCFFH